MTLTDSEIIEMIVGQRADRYGFNLLSTDRRIVGSLEVDGDATTAPSLQVDTTRTTFRTLSNVTVFNPPADADLTQLRLQPTVTLENGSVYPMGVLMFGQDSRNVYSAGDQWVPQLFDETFLLDQDLDKSWGGATGTSTLALFDVIAREVLDPLGVPIVYQVADVPLGSPFTAFVGTSRNAALLSLAKLLGALPPYFANNGDYTVKMPPAVFASADHVYGPGTRIFADTTVLTSSAYKAPNRYIVVGNQVGTVGSDYIRGVYDLPASSPNSYAATGRIVATSRSASGVTSNAVAAAMAYVDALTDNTTYGVASFSAALDPRHDIFDTVDLLGDTYLETGWTMSISHGGPHQHNLSRIWQ